MAFWPAYFSKLASSSFAFHLHGFTASLWILVLAFQNWSVHRRRVDLHRTVGRLSLGIFPLFFAGSLLILHSMAAKFSAASDPFYAMFGARLGIMDVVATAAIGWLYAEGLRQRRRAQLHARSMIATILFLLAPIFGRLLPILPPLAIGGEAELYRFGWSVQVANVLVLALAAALWFHAPKHGRAWLISGALVLLQILLFATVGTWPVWEKLYSGLATMPQGALLGAGLVAGAALSWLGWTAGAKDGRQPRPA